MIFYFCRINLSRITIALNFNYYAPFYKSSVPTQNSIFCPAKIELAINCVLPHYIVGFTVVMQSRICRCSVVSLLTGSIFSLINDIYLYKIGHFVDYRWQTWRDYTWQKHTLHHHNPNVCDCILLLYWGSYR